MSLLDTLVELPFAPLKALIMVAEQIEKQAAEEQAQELGRLEAELLELQLSDEAGAEARDKEDELIERLLGRSLVGTGVGAGDEE
jgi:hypothetical protein